MPEIPNVLPGGETESDWANLIRDRTVQRYVSEAARDSADPTPARGSVCYLQDKGILQVYGAGPIGNPPGWENFARSSLMLEAFAYTGIVATDTQGDFIITHNRGKNPTGHAISSAQASIAWPVRFVDNPSVNTSRYNSGNQSTFVTVSIVIFFPPT